MTKDIARNHNLDVDMDGFNKGYGKPEIDGKKGQSIFTSRKYRA
ncbi:MAG: hypothetical protein CM1200mP17_12770 [Woeseia sp.]|nr:MAG: hypothetical protein CM1200mP17_12770 [Woeseia sp.]